MVSVKGLLDPFACYGCRACEGICPKQCISMVEDDEGFIYPDVNFENCINCGLCEKVCPVNYNDFIDEEDIKVFICKNQSDDILKLSSSGGAFSTIYTYCINNNYVV